MQPVWLQNLLCASDASEGVKGARVRHSVAAWHKEWCLPKGKRALQLAGSACLARIL